MTAPVVGRHGPLLVIAVGTALLGTVMVTASLGMVQLASGTTVGRFTLPGGVLLVLVAVAGWSRRRAPRGWRATWTLVAVPVVLTVTASLLVSGSVPDTTYDGQWYHQEGVLRLLGGWNPAAGELGAGELPDAALRSRVNGYPKLAWLAGAAAVAATGRIDHAGWGTPVLAVAAWALAWAALVGGLGMSRRVAAVVSSVMAANPVVVTQLVNSQLDGDLASCLLVVAVTPWLRRATRSRLVLVAVAAAMVVAVGVKLTGAAFAVVLAVGAVAARRFDRPVAAAAAVGLAVGILVLGFHPYLTNLVRHGHPLYPALGPDADRLMDAAEIGRVEGLVVSAFSRSRHFATSAAAVRSLDARAGLKVPGSVTRAEIEAFAVPDVRVGGLGPLFGAVLVAALAAGALALRSVVRTAGGPALALLASVLAFPYPWFARLVPQLWLLPLVVAVAAIGSGRKAARAAGSIAVALAAVNVGLVAAGHLPNAVRHGRAVGERLRALAGTDGELVADLRPFLSNRARVAELGVRFQQVDAPDRSVHTVLGTWLPAVQSVRRAAGVVEVDWTRVRGATAYRVETWRGWPPPRGGGPLAAIDAQEPPASLPALDDAVAVTVRACNQLGCGPPAPGEIR